MVRVKRFLLIGVVVSLTAAAAAAPSLTAYVGKYPSDKIAGVSLYQNPKFRSRVAEAAPNSAIRSTVLASGVETPIEKQGALMVVQACEPHNCSDHQWTVAILAPSGPAAICYHDSDLMGAEGRWFIKGLVVGKTNGCWSGEQTAIPDAIFARLAKAG